MVRRSAATWSVRQVRSWWEPSVAIGLTFGLALVAVAAALGHVSGAHVNPAVTVALAMTGKFPWSYVPAYVGAQFFGAALAAVTVWGTYGSEARDEASLAASFHLRKWQ